MSRSTPGTRMRRELVTGLRTTKRQVAWLISTWAPYSSVMLTGAELRAAEENGAVGTARWRRDRREDEYPENQVRALRNSYATINAAIQNLEVLRDQIAKRYREVAEPEEAKRS